MKAVFKTVIELIDQKEENIVLFLNTTNFIGQSQFCKSHTCLNLRTFTPSKQQPVHIPARQITLFGHAPFAPYPNTQGTLLVLPADSLNVP